MRNYENAFPILYTLVGIFVIAWIANGAVGFVDGSGGPVVYDGEQTLYDSDFNPIAQPGDVYLCDEAYQVAGCKNSLAPFAGESGENGMFNSMPVGFYWDGIMFIVLGLLGLGGIAYLQQQIKDMRAAHRRSKSSDDSEEEESVDEESETGDASE